jgi:hypothetical protein
LAFFDRSLFVVEADAARPVKEGVRAVRVDVNLDPRPDEMLPQGARPDLPFQRAGGDAIVVHHLALLLDAQDLVEIDAGDRREGRVGLSRGDGEAGVVGG